MMGYSWDMTAFGWISMMLFWVTASVAALVFLARSFEGFSPHLPRADRSLEEAGEHLAKGELSQEAADTFKRNG
jgi:uncharacterized membrane protein